jgi:membrane-bound lytic murein transglycosylase A
MSLRMLVATVLALFLLTGCPQEPRPNFLGQLPPGTLALRKIPPEMYPGFAMNPPDLARIHPAIVNSLEYLSHPSSQHYYPYGDISHDRAVATLKALDVIASTAAQSNATPDWIDQQIRQNFEVYQSIGAPSNQDPSVYTGQVRFTGYFTPIYNVSLTRGGAYQWPIYKRPADLVSDPVTGDVYGRRLPDGTLVPYYTRAQIEGGVLAGQELCWLTSRFEAYVVTVQGSGRLRLPDGKIYEVGYAGQNGYQYVSAGEKMAADGVIPADQINLHNLHAYFDAHPADMDKYLSANPRIAFFAQRPGGPYGSLNVPVTPLATIATDKEDRDIYPRAMAAFLLVDMPQVGGPMAPYKGFFLDQDTGGAIRASGRCDIYMGIGEGAEDLAGRELTDGTMYYIAIKPELVGQYLNSGVKP